MLAFAQSTTSTYTRDINGRPVQGDLLTSMDGARTERNRSINGREVPLEQVEERVLRETPSGRITERIVRKFDPSGRLASSDRMVTEEQRRPGGGLTSHSTTYSSDVNGQMQESERATTELRVQGDTRSEQTTVERPTINGAFQPAEKREVVSQTSDSTTYTTEKVYRPRAGGEFYEVVRQVSEVKKTGDRAIENSAYYEPGVTSKLKLKSQTVSTTPKRPDGSELVEKNLYERSIPGIVQNNQAPQQVQEQ